VSGEEMFRHSANATYAHQTCVLELVPATCLRVWLLIANVLAWLLIIVAINKLLS
jgi:hypothetical protein